MDYQEFETMSGKLVLIETDVEFDQVELAGAKETAEEGARKFASAIDAVKPAANDLVEALSNLARKPDELEIEFGLKLNGEVGALIAKTSTEANFTVKMKWVKPGADD